jgi:antitoxin PrlF
MEFPKSKVTAQGQISIPAKIRKKLGVGPGSVLEWEEDGENIIVRRAGEFISSDIHKAVFPRGVSAAKSVNELKEGIRSHMKKRHARH